MFFEHNADKSLLYILPVNTLTEGKENKLAHNLK